MTATNSVSASEASAIRDKNITTFLSVNRLERSWLANQQSRRNHLGLALTP